MLCCGVLCFCLRDVSCVVVLRWCGRLLCFVLRLRCAARCVGLSCVGVGLGVVVVPCCVVDCCIVVGV